MTSPSTVVLSIPPALPKPLAQICSHQVTLDVYILVTSQFPLWNKKDGNVSQSDWSGSSMQFLLSCFVSINLPDVKLPILTLQAFHSFPMQTLHAYCRSWGLFQISWLLECPLHFWNCCSWLKGANQENKLPLLLTDKRPKQHHSITAGLRSEWISGGHCPASLLKCGCLQMAV